MSTKLNGFGGELLKKDAKFLAGIDARLSGLRALRNAPTVSQQIKHTINRAPKPTNG